MVAFDKILKKLKRTNVCNYISKLFFQIKDNIHKASNVELVIAQILSYIGCFIGCEHRKQHKDFCQEVKQMKIITKKRKIGTKIK